MRRPLTPYEINHPELSQLDFWDMPATPKQQHERYVAMIDFPPRRETHVKLADPWAPLKGLAVVTGVLLVGIIALAVMAGL